MPLTKRNHTNPCSWTAYWNNDYFENSFSSSKKSLNPRKQIIFSLNIKANKVYRASVRDVHYEEGIGIAEITAEAAKKFCIKYFPKEYKRFSKYMKKHPESLILEGESLFNAIENTPSYKTVHEVIKKDRIETREEIVFLAGFIFFQHIRSHAILHSALEQINKMGIERFEYYWLLKQAITNPDYMYNLILPLATSQWIIYKAKDHILPLPDTPVLIKPGNVMISLSPRMLVDIDLKKRFIEGNWKEIDKIPKNKVREYKKRAISNTYKEIIFNDKFILEKWRNTTEFKNRVKLLSNSKTYSELIKQTQLYHLRKI